MSVVVGEMFQLVVSYMVVTGYDSYNMLEANFDAYITSFLVHTSCHATFGHLRYVKGNIWCFEK